MLLSILQARSLFRNSPDGRKPSPKLQENTSQNSRKCGYRCPFYLINVINRRRQRQPPDPTLRTVASRTGGGPGGPEILVERSDPSRGYFGVRGRVHVETTGQKRPVAGDKRADAETA